MYPQITMKKHRHFKGYSWLGISVVSLCMVFQGYSWLWHRFCRTRLMHYNAMPASIMPNANSIEWANLAIMHMGRISMPKCCILQKHMNSGFSGCTFWGGSTLPPLSPPPLKKATPPNPKILLAPLAQQLLPPSPITPNFPTQQKIIHKPCPWT